jgi:hypothetical protein
MVNARHSFAFMWQRLVAALSLVMAASLAPAVAAPAGGAGGGAVGSRASSGAAVASAANALAGNVAALIEGGQLEQPLDAPTDGTAAKAFTIAFWQEIVLLRPAAAQPPPVVHPAPPTHAARSGPARAPPVA